MLKKCVRVVSSLTAALRFDADLNGDVTLYPLCAVLLRHLCREGLLRCSPLQIKMHNLIVNKHCQLRHTLILSQIFLSTFFSYVI